MDFRIYGDKSLLQDAQNVITDLEKKVSVTDSDSEIYKINENGSGILSGEADTLMKMLLKCAGVPTVLWIFPSTQS